MVLILISQQFFSFAVAFFKNLADLTVLGGEKKEERIRPL
jgi:hypothetical protein